MTNQEILEIYSNLNKAFENNDKYIPVKIGFLIQNNKNKLFSLATEIEISRIKICENYGKLSKDEEYYIFSEENQEKFVKELNDLLKIEQNVDIKKIKLKDIEDLEFTLEQIDALMFMIEEE